MTGYDPTKTQQTQLAKVPPPQIPVAAGASPQVQPAPALARSIGGAMAPQGSAGAGIAQAKPLATAQPPASTQGPEAKEAARLQASKPGVQQVHNPFLRTLATVGDALASTFAPRLATVLPGTTLHHNMLLNQAERGAKGEQEAQTAQVERGLKEAETQNQLSEAESRSPKKNAPVRVAAGEGLWDTSQNKWLVEPTRKDDEKLTEVDPEIGHRLGIHPTADGKYMVPNQALGSLLKPKEAPTPKTLLEKAMADHPDWTAEQLRDFEQKQGKVPLEEQVINEHLQRVHPGESMAQARQHTQPVPMTDRGQNFVDPTSHKLIRVEPGGAVPEGAVTAGGLNSENVKTAEQTQAETKAKADAKKEYQLAENLAAHPSPTNDVALLMRYIGATKPDSLGKLRLNQNEISLVLGTRSTLGDLEALEQKVVNGQKLTPQQRKDMLSSMRIMAGIDEGGGNVRVQQNSKGEFRYTTDGGKTWQNGKPPK